MPFTLRFILGFRKNYGLKLIPKQFEHFDTRISF